MILSSLIAMSTIFDLESIPSYTIPSIISKSALITVEQENVRLMIYKRKNISEMFQNVCFLLIQFSVYILEQQYQPSYEVLV